MTQPITVGQKLKQVEDGLEYRRDMFPPENFEWLKERILHAVRDYLTTSSLADSKQQIDEIIKACKACSPDLKEKLNDLPSSTRGIIDGLDPIDIENLSPEELAEQVLPRVMTSEWWVQEGNRIRRKQSSPLRLPRGQPLKSKEHVLTSFIASACAGATGKRTVRSWDEDEDTLVETILEDVLINIGYDGKHSAKSLVKAHVKSMKSIK